MIIKNYIYFFSISFSLILIDLLTKQFLFTWAEYGKTGDGRIIYQNPLIGIRSIANPGLTFVNFDIPVWLVNFFSIVILLISLGVVFFIRSWFLLFWSIFTFAGTFGNFFDRALFDGTVRDIIFFTFLQNATFLSGTFNLADAFVTIGSIFGIIFIFILIIDEIKRNRRKKT